MIAELRKIAIDKGGQCLSTEYINNHTKMRWRCHKGHEWQASAANVKVRNSWCPICAGNVKLNISIMQDVASKHNGKCLSKEYKNAQTKLEWQCTIGHIWQATYSNISRGKWCPECVGRKKPTIEDMCNFAALKGGKCLSTEYINNQAKLMWVCKYSHKWLASHANISRGTWCPTCSGNKRLSIEEIAKIIEAKGGKCLTREYKNLYSKIKIKCAKGHIWTTTANSIKHSNNWCSVCAGNKKLSIMDMHTIALAREGRCLSTEYRGNTVKLVWECKEGHQWEATPQSIRNLKTWCPKCYGNSKHTLERMHLAASERRGKCLEIEYTSSKVRMKWECELGHKFQASAEKVIHRKQWCPKCAGNEKKTLDEMIYIAKNRHGNCISTQYVNSSTNLTWICEFGHQWEATPSNVMRGKWCPDCSGSRGESAVRAFLEKGYGNKFPKKRPFWLKRDKSRFELDGFCEELKIAFEYHGNYHFDEKHNWYPDGYPLQKRQDFDRYKREKCKEYGIHLIEVPEFPPHASNKDKKQLVLQAIKSSGLGVPEGMDTIDFGADIWFQSRNLFEEAWQLAVAREGVCLTNIINSAHAKIQWQCKENHTWFATIYTIKKGHWCLQCAGKAKSTINMMYSIAASRGGFCLSKEYVNAKTPLQWQCGYGHQWTAKPLSVKNHNTWCPYCARNKFNKENLQSVFD